MTDKGINIKLIAVVGVNKGEITYITNEIPNNAIQSANSSAYTIDDKSFTITQQTLEGDKEVTDPGRLKELYRALSHLFTTYNTSFAVPMEETTTKAEESYTPPKGIKKITNRWRKVAIGAAATWALAGVLYLGNSKDKTSPATKQAYTEAMKAYKSSINVIRAQGRFGSQALIKDDTVAGSRRFVVVEDINSPIISYRISDASTMRGDKTDFTYTIDLASGKVTQHSSSNPNEVDVTENNQLQRVYEDVEDILNKYNAENSSDTATSN